MADNEWTDAELEAAVSAYFDMLAMQRAGQPFVKRQIARALMEGPLSARNSIDQRMQNISSLLAEAGEPWLQGYKPLANVGSARQRARIWAIIDRVRGATAPTLAPTSSGFARHGAPEPSYEIRRGVMHMRRAPASTYLFSLGGASTPAFKVGWAFDWRRRLRDFNHASMPAIGGILYKHERNEPWPEAKAAFRMEQGVLACFAAARHPGNQEIIIGVPLSEIIGAWSETAAKVA